MRVLCILPNAAEEISGIRFERTDAGMLSVDMEPDAAAAFARIPGYVAVACEPEPAVDPDPAKRGPGRPTNPRGPA